MQYLDIYLSKSKNFLECLNDVVVSTLKNYFENNLQKISELLNKYKNNRFEFFWDLTPFLMCPDNSQEMCEYDARKIITYYLNQNELFFLELFYSKELFCKIKSIYQLWNKQEYQKYRISFLNIFLAILRTKTIKKEVEKILNNFLNNLNN